MSCHRMLLKVIFATALITVATAQENSKQQNDESNENNDHKPSVVYAGTPNPELPQQNKIQSPVDLKQFYTGQPYSPELYRLAYLEPQYQAQEAFPRLQPQIVLYSSGGQGQPILINPGNPPGNFLFPQGPGPNVIVGNNPQSSQDPVFPVAGYPKPAHIPPIEKDAEEIPTNPGNIPPLPSEAKPVTKPRNKPEKLETFNDPNQPDQNVNFNTGQFPQAIPKTIGLQPGQRIFVLNGDQIFSYPFEAQSQIQNDVPAFRYTNVQHFPQNPPKFLQTFGQEPAQLLQRGQENAERVPVPHLLQHDSFINPQQPENERRIITAPQYFRTAFPVNTPEFLQFPQNYPISQQEASNGPLKQNIQEIQGVEGINSKDEVIQPQVVGQFRFTPSAVPALFPFKDDFENDAIVVDASFDAPSNFNGRGGNIKAEESESTTTKQEPAQKESEPSMAQAGPQATAIAGIGGVAGAAPRGTAIVGKGGLAVSSPQATAVAGTKDEEKKKRPVKKNT